MQEGAAQGVSVQAVLHGNEKRKDNEMNRFIEYGVTVFSVGAYLLVAIFCISITVIVARFAYLFMFAQMCVNLPN